MIKRQKRNNLVSCLASELVNNFPPYSIGGVAVREHSICEVMDDVSKTVVATYKLHSDQWYRYDLISVFPPYPPQPQPLERTISLGLIVPNIPSIINPLINQISVTPVSTSTSETVPTIPTINHEES